MQTISVASREKRGKQGFSKMQLPIGKKKGIMRLPYPRNNPQFYGSPNP
jgi:hypothetical protein